MAVNLIEKLTNQAINEKASYIIFTVSDSGIAYTSDGGTRKSTKNFKLSEKEINVYEKQLKDINGNSLLFSETVSRIDITIRDGRKAFFERSDLPEEIIAINSKKLNELNVKTNKWVRYKKDNSGIAFLLKEMRNGSKIISPCDGELYNGLLKRDVDLDLKFCACGEYENIISLVKNIFEKIVFRREFQISSFSVLPNSMDDDNELTSGIISAIREVCDKYPVFKSEKGTFLNRKQIMFGSKEVKELFPQDICVYTFVGNRGWLRDCDEGTREEFFLMVDIGLVKYDKSKFLEFLFKDDYLDELADLLSKQNDRWLRKFYIFCMENDADEQVQNTIATGLRNIKCIRSSKNKMVYPKEASLMISDDSTLGKTILVKSSLIYPGGNEDEYSSLLIDFFSNNLGMAEYSRRPEIIKLAEELSTKKQSIDNNYCLKLMKLVSYNELNPDDIDFSEYTLFPVETNRGMKRLKGTEIVVGKPYIKEGILLSKALDRPQLWSGFSKCLSAKDSERLVEFSLKCGAVGLPHIIKQSANMHIDYKKSLYADGRQGARDSDYDFTIPELDTILKRRSLQLNKLIWECVVAVPKGEASDYLFAEYSVNGREIVNRCYSSLIQIMKQRVWIPDKNNKLFAPGDIDIKDINDDFIFDKRNPILKHLRFGSTKINVDDEIKRLKKEASKVGMEVISKEEYQEYISWKNKRKK